MRTEAAREDLLKVIGCEIGLRPAAPGLAELVPKAVSRERDGDALRVVFPPSAEGDLRAFAEAERVCCPGISWEVETGDQLLLTGTGSKDAISAIERVLDEMEDIEDAQLKEIAMATQSEIKDEVKRRYGAAAKRAQAQQQSGECCGAGDGDGISSNLYATDELQHLPQDAVAASLGCGNPVAVAELKEGEVVLDLGSGGGIDVLLSARRVGPTGKAYGLDMTDEMLDLARKNASEAGVSNVEFLRGEMENIPLPRNTADVIISNCVVNLSPDKDAVLREAYRVLKPGGRLAISDIVTNNDLPEAIKENMAAWTGCIAGALTRDDYIAKLQAAGFEGAEIETFREYTAADAMSGDLGDEVREIGDETRGVGVFSGVVRARKPVTATVMEERIEVLAAEAGTSCGPGECC